MSTKDDALKLAREFNRYFTSANSVDVPERISVPRDEWREVYEAFREALAEQPAQQEIEPPSDENIADAWVSASDSDGIAYDAPSFERGYRLGRGEYNEYTGALVADALAKQPAPVQQGWKLVPVDPTIQMCLAGAKAADSNDGAAENAYHAMLAAAPQPAQQEPLTQERVRDICEEAGYDMATMQERADFINGIRHGEAAHSIKGQP